MIEIISLEEKDKEKAIEVLFSAFLDYPLMNFYFGNAYLECGKHFHEFLWEISPIFDWLMLGAFVEGKLLGFATVSAPENPEKAEEDIEGKIAELGKKFVMAVGEEAARRMERYLNLKNAHLPSQPHFYLNAIGVDPQSQNMGIGSAILDKVQLMSQEHPESCGVALDTEIEKNVIYYQNRGYQVYSQDNLDDVKIWFMFRPNSKAN